MLRLPILFFFFFFNDTATTEIYTLSLHDALPISSGALRVSSVGAGAATRCTRYEGGAGLRAPPSYRVHLDRKSTRLNSSHSQISYAVFCLKKKKKKKRSQLYAKRYINICDHIL